MMEEAIDVFLGITIDDFVVIKAIDSGAVGRVYICENIDLGGKRAIKFVLKSVLDKKPNWKSEIIKVISLRQTEGIVHYHSHNFTTIDSVEYLYMFWDYIESDSLKSLIEKKSVSIPMLLDIINRIFDVFHACRIVGIQHSDLHSGNILIQKPDNLSMEPERRKVWVTDFGYGSFSDEVQPLEDYKGFARIIQECLSSINFHFLEKNERMIYSVLKNEFPKYLLETNRMEGEYVRNPKALKQVLISSFNKPKEEEDYEKNVGDFLAAELIGDRYDEWNTLFVPKFLAIDDLLDKNICMLTGLRGCGKTMMYKRLSFPLSLRLGKAGVPGEDNFVGFYLNARHIAESFPWLPDKFEKAASEQLIHFFHIKWSLEILEWVKEIAKAQLLVNSSWISDFFKSYFPDFFTTAISNDSVINHVISFLSRELQIAKLGSRYDTSKTWALVDFEYLEKLTALVKRNIDYARVKDFYFFLDDYSTPLVTYSTQRILNQIVFRRSPNVFFKVSTESVESFYPRGLNEKVLEEGADYKLIDLGTELLLKDQREIKDIISSIFERRISRGSIFADKGVTLHQLLGIISLSNNERALRIRDNERQTLYFGVDDFCDLWSSDIRELIKIFADMISQEGRQSIEEKLFEGAPKVNSIISTMNQDKVFRDAGGRFLNLLASATNPAHYTLDIVPDIKTKTYGSHLVDIVRAFQQIAYYDLKNKDSKNQEQNPPKLARKIELTSTNDQLSSCALSYYKGLIRYGVFIQDNRAKSVRGTVSTRLYFRSLLIPYSRLTFSKRDSITLDWDNFVKMLENPNEFKKQYIKNQAIQLNKEVLSLDRKQITIEESICSSPDGGL